MERALDDLPALPATLEQTAVLGAGGFLGRHFLAAYRRLHPGALGTVRPGRAAQRDDLAGLDLAAPDLGPLRLAETGHRAALVTAGLARIAECEAEPARTRAVNLTGTLAVCRDLLAAGLRPILLSTDYVFDGVAGGYADDAPTCPTTEYGRQKAALEREAVALAPDRVLVVRLSKVYGLVRGDGTLLDEMAARLTQGREVAAASDQTLTPTWVGDVVRAVAALQAAGASGVVNVAAPAAWTRHALALALADALGAPRALVRRISLDDLGFVPPRPKDTSLVSARLAAVGLDPLLAVPAAIARVAASYQG